MKMYILIQLVESDEQWEFFSLKSEINSIVKIISRFISYTRRNPPFDCNIFKWSIFIKYKSSESSTSSSAASSGGVGGDRSDVFDSSDFHAETGQGSQSGLGSRSGGLRSSTSSSSELDVEGVDSKLFAASDDIVGSHHSGVRGRLFSISFHLHTTSDTDQGFAAGQVGHVDKSVIESSQNMSNSEDCFSFLKIKND